MARPLDDLGLAKAGASVPYHIVSHPETFRSAEGTRSRGHPPSALTSSYSSRRCCVRLRRRRLLPRNPHHLLRELHPVPDDPAQPKRVDHRPDDLHLDQGLPVRRGDDCLH
jgi:hypothetical protein